MRGSRRAAAVLGALAVLSSAGCRSSPRPSSGSSGGPSLDAPECRAALSAAEAADLGAPLEAGSWRVTFVSETGTAPGLRATGTLRLRSVPDSLRKILAGGGDAPSATAEAPLYGTLTAELAPLGFVDTGALDADDPSAPGVLVLRWRADGEVRTTLRLGAKANRRGMVRFDGSYAVLEPQVSLADGFAGRWRSGGGSDREAAGRFCAATLPADPA